MLVSQNGTVLTNYFPLSSKTPFFKYKITIEPEIPNNQLKLLYRVLLTLKNDLSQIFKIYQPINFMVYSPTQSDSFTLTTEYENIEYKITFESPVLIELSKDHKESTAFFGRLLKLLQNKIKLKPVGRKYFNPEKAENFSNWKLAIWPGYQSSLKCHKEQVVMNIDLSFKLIRQETVYEYMKELMQKFRGNQERVKNEIIGQIVMTKYNNRFYRVYDIEFDLDPKMLFKAADGKEISYLKYYEMKYNKKLLNPSQPLLKFKSKTKDIHLIPELCVLTGQSSEMRQNFQLQKDLNSYIKPSPSSRLEGCKGLIKSFESNPATKDLMREWDISISKTPLEVRSVKLDPGNLLMGEDNKYPLEGVLDLDRKIQKPMLEQPELNKVAIFYSKRDDQENVQKFIDHLKKSTETFNYPLAQPKLFAIEGRDYRDWERAFQTYLNISVQAVILILPGKKKNCPFYNDCKKSLLMKYPIPSQVILSSTIASGRNLGSIVNKVLIQLCAKVGGTPWSISDVPFLDKPTMIVGMDVVHKISMKNKLILSYCGTVNRNLSKYWSTVSEHSSNQEIGNGIQSAVISSIEEFQKLNNFPPNRIIVYRDGLRNIFQDIEIDAFTRAFVDLNIKPEFFFIQVNKTPNTKFFAIDSRNRSLGNPEPGTAVFKDITNGNDFYLISQKILHGTVNPTHYSVLKYMLNIEGNYVDNKFKMSEDVLTKLLGLTYKLCFLYYNFSGAIKVPAPFQYAQRLANLVAESWKPNEVLIPNKQFQEFKSLYFI